MTLTKQHPRSVASKPAPLQNAEGGDGRNDAKAAAPRHGEAWGRVSAAGYGSELRYGRWATSTAPVAASSTIAPAASRGRSRVMTLPSSGNGASAVIELLRELTVLSRAGPLTVGLTSADVVPNVGRQFSKEP